MLVLVGCNHRSAPVAFREKLAFSSDEIPAALARLRGCHGIDEAVILSTCNRVEVIVRGEGAAGPGIATVKHFLCAERGIGIEQIDGHAYLHSGLDAVRHIFRVATGLDSMILGEPQILGQVKQAYLASKALGATGTVIEQMLQQCLRTAKRIRTETGISRNAVSVAFAAVNLARQIFGKLEGRRTLLIGAGKMTQLVARHLVSHGVTDVVVTSRTYDHAVTLAGQCSGRPVHWDDGLGRLSEMDIVVSCTASPRTILSRNQVLEARQRRRGEPLFIIDIAVPRDVDPDVNDLDNVYLYDIDGLQGVVDANIKERRHSATQAEQMIEDEVQAFDHWRQSLEITPTIVSLRETIFEMARHEVERLHRRTGPLSSEQHKAVEEMTRALVQKILHRPVLHLKKSVERGDVDASTSLYRQIFGLDRGPRTGDGGEQETEHESRGGGQGPQRLLRGGKED